MNVFIDIETIPAQPEAKAKALIAESIQHPAQMKRPETIADWHNGVGKYAGEKDAAIESAYRSTALDGSAGEVLSIGWRIENSETQVRYRDIHEPETGLIEGFFLMLKESLDDAGRGRPPLFIGHNITFDLKFLFRRCVVLGIKPPFALLFRGKHDRDYFCTMEAWCDFKERCSQDKLAGALGIPQKPDEIDGSKVWDFVKAGEIERVAEYNKYDVDTVFQIYNRLRFN